MSECGTIEIIDNQSSTEIVSAAAPFVIEENNITEITTLEDTSQIITQETIQEINITAPGPQGIQGPPGVCVWTRIQDAAPSAQIKTLDSFSLVSFWAAKYIANFRSADKKLCFEFSLAYINGEMKMVVSNKFGSFIDMAIDTNILSTTVNVQLTNNEPNEIRINLIRVLFGD